jgi:hypothetical protein
MQSAKAGSAAAVSPNFADSTRCFAIFAGQVIERREALQAQTPKIGCGADSRAPCIHRFAQPQPDVPPANNAAL